MQKPQPAKLALEDGTVFLGESLGAQGEIDGEVVFNTSMTGYQEILTDPSYRGQIVTMTYPEMGNYGVNAVDREHPAPYLAGFIVRQESRVFSNYRATGSLGAYLREHRVVGIAGIDTRALVRRLRNQGAMRGVLSSIDLDDASLIEKARRSPGLIGRDLVQEVMPKRISTWTEPLDDLGFARVGIEPLANRAELSLHVVCLDYGMKQNIPRHFVSRGNRVTILPGTATADEVLARQPDGVFLSNGPGDPEPIAYAQKTIAGLVGKVPVFGICLGHQLLSLACGAKTFKLKFGHRGANQPVQDLRTGKIEITPQNHGFAVDEQSLPEDLEVTHKNVNDDTVAGVRHRRYPAFSVQYHPEASSGPHDSAYLFDEFQELMEAHRNRSSKTES
jgi:carbamoyl-phosphate synthase small subunit